MSISAAFVLFAVIWFMLFLIILPLRVQSQSEAGSVVPGTPPGAPAGLVVRRKARLTTLLSVVLWILFYLVIISGWITVRDLDVMGRMPPATVID